MTNVLDCDIIGSEFESQLHYFVHIWTNIFGKGINLFIPPATSEITLQLFFYNDDFGIK